MKYEKAKDILPEELLREVQKYAAGKLLYIPSGEEKRNWGETSGYRQKLLKRNQMICNKYANGMTISELADEYYLSLESIKKIVYTKKKDGILQYSPTLSSALAYSDAGMTEEWICSFLMFTCEDNEIAKKLILADCYYYGPAKLPLRLIWDEGMEAGVDHKLPTTAEQLQDETADRYTCHEPVVGEDTPPLIVHFIEGRLRLSGQQLLFEDLRRKKVNAYPVFVWLEGKEDYRCFMNYYGQFLRYISNPIRCNRGEIMDP